MYSSVVHCRYNHDHKHQEEVVLILLEWIYPNVPKNPVEKINFKVKKTFIINPTLAKHQLIMLK